MNEWLKRLLSKIKELWAKWTITQKVILVGIVVAAIALIIFVFSFSSSPSTVPLFNTGITDEVLRERIMFRLSEENVDASVNETTGIISVNDEATARRMRSILVREDLVPGTMDPWALFDVERWTTTDFERNVNLQRSITNVITKHIEALDDIDKAHVVVQLPEDSLFVADQKPVTASVILYPKPGSDFNSNKKKIQGVQKLLLKAITGLTAENITITDEAGNVLNDFEGLQDIERVDIIKKEQKLIAELEAQYRAKILAALQNYYSIDRVRDLNVKFEMDMSKRITNATEYSPIILKEDNKDTPYDDSKIVESITISSQTIDKKWTGSGHNPEGPSGVEGQNPPVYSDMSNLIGSSEENSQTKNQVVNTKQITEERTPSTGRVTVAVGIDGRWKMIRKNGEPVINEDGGLTREYIPLTAIELEDAQKIVQDAIGYNKGRGDSVTVRNIQYDRTEQFEEEDAEFFKSLQTKKTIIYVLSGIAIVLLAFIIFRFVSREMERRRRLREEELSRKAQLEREQRLWEADQAGMDVVMSVEERRRAELQENAITMAKEHPEDVANLIRSWLMEE